MTVFDWLKDKYKQSINEAKSAVNFVKQQPDNFRVGMNVARNPNQSRTTRFAQGLVHGTGKALVDAVSLSNKLMTSRVANVLNPATLIARKYQPQKQLRINKFRTNLDMVAPTTTAGKAGSFVGENLPALMLPATNGFTALKIASPAQRLLANSLLRGVENAAYGASVKYARGERITPKSVVGDVGTGAAFNAALSPIQSVKAVMELSKNYKELKAEKNLINYLNSYASKFASTNERPVIKKLLDEFEYTKGNTPQNKKAIANLLEKETNAQKIFDYLKTKVPEPLKISYYKQGTAPGFVRLPQGETKKPATSKPAVKPPRTFEPKETGAFDPYNTGQQSKKDSLYLRARETIQDRLIRQKNLQKGANVADGSNPYQAEELFHGRVASRIEKTKADFEGLFSKMNDYSRKGGIEFKKLRGAVNKYLQATHAPERNLQHGAGAAGMTDSQAKAVLGEIGSSPHNKAVREFAGELKKMSDQTLDILKEGGVLSQKQVDTLRTTYKNHVPLNRIMDDDVFSSLSGKGYDVKSTGIKRAVGSEREADDIAGNILANLEQATVRAEKNRFGLNVLEFSRKNKDLDMFDISGPKTIGKTFDDKFISDKNLPENALSVFENGKQKIITIKDPKLAAALKGVNVEQIPAQLRMVAAITRLYSSLATRFNYEFPLSNIVRDSQELAVYVASQSDMPKGSVSRVTKNIPASLNDVRRYIAGDLSSDGSKLYKQMIEDGGTTGGMGLSTRGDIQLDISKMEKLVQSKPRQAAHKVIETVDNLNQIFEDATRLSAYKEAIKAGLSRERAASIAKNATVNFNRKGTAGTIINSLYMFSNASIQGTAKVLTSMKNPKVAAATIASVTGPVYAINKMNDSIDPDWRDKVTDWDRQSNLVVMLPSEEGSKYFTIPVSWGLKPIKVIADQSYDIATGKAGDAYGVANKIVSAFTDAYNPVGGTDIPSAATPSILDTPMDIWRNKKWTGSKIRSDKELVANHQNYFGSLANSPLGRASISATEKIAGATNNRIDINPADMNYAIQQFISGAGRSVERAITTGTNLLKKEKTDTKDIPFVNRFMKTQDQEQIEKNLTYKDKGDFEKKLKKMKAGSDDQKDFIQEYLWNQPKEDRQGIIYGLQLKGIYTKGLTVKDKTVALRDRDIEEKGERFLNSGKALEVIGDQVFRADNTERGYSVTTKIKYDQDVMETKKTRLKKNDDVKGWMENAEKLYTNYEEQLKDPKLDDLEKMKIQGKMEDLLAEGKKYAGYGGKFKKGKKAKKITLNLSMPTRASRASIKLRKPTAPRISLISQGGLSSGTAPTGQPRSIRIKRQS